MPVRRKAYLDPSMAENAIPYDAITLTEASGIVRDAIKEQPSKMAEIDEERLDALYQSRKFMRLGRQPQEVYKRVEMISCGAHELSCARTFED
jgi:hypothetical protein